MLSKIILLFTLFWTSATLAIQDGTFAKDSDPEILSTVAITSKVEDGTGRDLSMKCTGALIAEDTVLTASHCFYNLYTDSGDPKPSAIHVGLADAGSDTEWIVASEVRPYPETRNDLIHLNQNLSKYISAAYKAKTFAEYSESLEKFNQFTYGLNDVAILKLSKNFSKKHSIAAIDFSGEIQVGEEVTLAGYGFEQDLVPIPSSSLKLLNMKATMIQNHAVVLIGLNGRSLAGDSGGPLYIKRNNKLYVSAVNIVENYKADKSLWDQQLSVAYQVGATMMSTVKFKEFIEANLKP